MGKKQAELLFRSMATCREWELSSGGKMFDLYERGKTDYSVMGLYRSLRPSGFWKRVKLTGYQKHVLKLYIMNIHYSGVSKSYRVYEIGAGMQLGVRFGSSVSMNG